MSDREKRCDQLCKFSNQLGHVFILYFTSFMSWFGRRQLIVRGQNVPVSEEYWESWQQLAHFLWMNNPRCDCRQCTVYMCAAGLRSRRAVCEGCGSLQDPETTEAHTHGLCLDDTQQTDSSSAFNALPSQVYRDSKSVLDGGWSKPISNPPLFCSQTQRFQEQHRELRGHCEVPNRRNRALEGARANAAASQYTVHRWHQLHSFSSNDPEC